MRGWVTGLLVILTAFSGCSGPGATGPDLPELVWASSYTITTTPLEPFELQGTNVIGYAGLDRGLFVQNEDDMARQNVRMGDTWYTTTEGRGWLRHDDQASLDASSRAHRLQTWDPRGLVEAAHDARATGDELVTRTSVTANGRTETVTVTAILEAGRVTSARIDSPFDPESPYTAEAGGTLPFAIRAPATSLPPADAATGEDAARTHHARIIGWIDAYRTQTGGLPRTVDAQTLTVQRLGAPWPTNPFDGQAMRHADASGHFLWHYCSAQDGSYEGFGWDKSPLGESFGAGCES